MFKIKNSTIHCSRGDGGTVQLKIPIVDANNYIKYKDASEKIYWYNTKSKTLYDSNYEKAEVSVDTLSMVLYEFQVGDKVTFNIYEKKGYDKEPLMKKEVIVSKVTDCVDIPLMKEDTTFGEPINKPTTFWYDITLNENMTVVCYNEDGEKEFIEYPAKGEGE